MQYSVIKARGEVLTHSKNTDILSAFANCKKSDSSVGGIVVSIAAFQSLTQKVTYCMIPFMVTFWKR